MINLEVLGNVGKDAESKEINGVNYVSFSIADTKKVRGEDVTTWVRVLKRDPENKLQPYITKGKPLYVCGVPSVSTYINKEGNPVASIDMFAEKIAFVRGGGDNVGQSASGNARQAQPSAVQTQQAPQPQNTQTRQQPTRNEEIGDYFGSVNDGDDLPF